MIRLTVTMSPWRRSDVTLQGKDSTYYGNSDSTWQRIISGSGLKIFVYVIIVTTLYHWKLEGSLILEHRVHVSKKVSRNVVCNIFYRTSTILMKLVCSIPSNLPQSTTSVSHFTWVVSLHSLVNRKGRFCEIPILQNNKLEQSRQIL